MWSKIEKRLNEKCTQVRLQTYEDIVPTVNKNKKNLIYYFISSTKTKKGISKLIKIVKGSLSRF